MVSDNSDLLNIAVISVALTSLLIIAAMNHCSDIVCDISGSDIYGPDKCGSNKCSYDIVSGMVFDKLTFINMGWTSVLWYNMTIPTVSDVTDKYDSDMHSSTDTALTCTDSQYPVFLSGSTYLIVHVHYITLFQ